MFKLETPAKINWFLYILGKRKDGYHDILSLMQTVSLYDALTFEESDRIEIITDAPIPEHENLVYKAAVALKEMKKVKTGAKVTLNKQIPISAGMGGGSSDAACTLLGLNRLWGLNLTKIKLSLIGAELGSDIPFFLNGPASLVEGRGEKITKIKMKKTYPILLVKPPISVSSRWAYEKFDSLSGGSTKKMPSNKTLSDGSKTLLDKIDKGFLFGEDVLRNDLEEVVIKEHSVIGELKDLLMEKGALASLMSGSGPTVFGVFKDMAEAEKAAMSLEPSYWSRVVETIG